MKMNQMLFNKVKLFSIFFLLSICTTTIYAQNKSVVVVELFTSQGDINCLSADKLLTEINDDANKNNKEIYCLSEHVDFWNRFGWTDPFSSIKYTRRLQNYSSVLNEKETYTPKFIVNGKSVGKNPDKATILKFINKELETPAQANLTFEYQVFADTLDLSYNINDKVSKNKSGSNWYINVVLVDNKNETKVTKGDNAGKTLVNSNVVKLFHTTNLNTSTGLLRIALKGIKKDSSRSIIVFIQDKKSKQVIGASGKLFD